MSASPSVFPATLSTLDLRWERLAIAVAALVLAWLLSRFGQLLLRNAAKRNMVDQGLSYSLGRLQHYFLMTLGVLVAVRILGVDLGSFVILGGALGVGIGFGLQSVVGNFVAGLVLLFERPIRVGDRVSLGTTNPDAQRQVNGFVRRIGLRATTVVTPDNIALIVPNSEFTTRTIVNWSLGDQRVRVRIVIGVAYGSDVARVRSAMQRVAAQHPKILKEPAPAVRLTGTGESALEFQLLGWITDPRDHGPVLSELRESVVQAFREGGIVIPFPQRDVHLTEQRPSV